MLKKYGFRAANVVLGIFLIGIAVGFLRMAAFGCDPFTTMNLGISGLLKLQFGNLQLLVNFILLVPVLLLRRKDLIGFGTVFNMVFVGYLADFTVFLFHAAGITASAMPARIFLFAAAFFIICLGDSLYIGASMGVAPYDAAAYLLETLTHKKLPFKYARILSDVSCVVAGTLTSLPTGKLWSIVGLGTIVIACGTGPMVQLFLDRIASPLFTHYAYD
ncbi:MAG: hypothetical protein LKE53_05950 [Oscillospiraceae bacterium]|jgi:uncharacterized membrane protein YczE|nr:hypothetical protein [Oscillospiraceae bacterium]MDD3260826.1 hypothetical protein [Oscillospiraceae bacterium]